MMSSSRVSPQDFYCLSLGISDGMRLLTWGVVNDFSFLDCSSPFYFFVKWISICFFHLLYSANMLCLLLMYLIGFHTLFSCYFNIHTSLVLTFFKYFNITVHCKSSHFLRQPYNYETTQSYGTRATPYCTRSVRLCCFIIMLTQRR